MTCFLKDMNSYLQLCGLLEDFFQYSGLRINNDKTEIFAIGSFKLAQRDFNHNIGTVSCITVRQYGHPPQLVMFINYNMYKTLPRKSFIT